MTPLHSNPIVDLELHTGDLLGGGIVECPVRIATGGELAFWQPKRRRS